jgi:hypothetical protein
VDDILSISGGIYGKREIEEFSSKNILIQDKWLLFARMKLCNIGWLQRQDIKRLQLIKRVVALGSFSLVVLVTNLALPPLM